MNVLHPDTEPLTPTPSGASPAPHRGDVSQFTRMTTAPVPGLIMSMALPSMAIMIVSALYNMADTYFVGYLGTSQVAAVGIAFPLMAIIQAIGFFFGQGSGNYMARALGAQERAHASRMAATGFCSGFAMMAVIALAGICLLGPLVGILGATPTIIPYAKDYLLYVLLASPWMAASTILNQQLRFQGAVSIAMIGTISGAVLNIVLDPICIFVLDLGVKGAAIATMTSQIVSFGILWWCTEFRPGSIPIRFTHFAPTRERYVEMFRGGVPSLLRQGLMSLATIVINHFAAVYGDEAVAAITIVQRLSMIAGTIMLGFGQGFQPMCGFNYGAGLFKRVKSGFWFAVWTGSVSMVVMAAVMAIWAPEIIALFRRDDPAVIRIGALGLRLQCLSMPVITWTVLCNMMTQTMGKAFYASLLAVARQGVFLIPSLCILSLGAGFGLLGIQMSLPVADICGCIMAIPIGVKVLGELAAPAPTGRQCTEHLC